LIDANGNRHQLKPDHSPRYLAREIPRDLPEGEVMFKQGKQTIVTPIINHAHPRVRVPSSLLPGEVYLFQSPDGMILRINRFRHLAHLSGDLRIALQVVNLSRAHRSLFIMYSLYLVF
jgi:hypothetical protein